jgi:SAM-dependent methyltransferase
MPPAKSAAFDYAKVAENYDRLRGRDRNKLEQWVREAVHYCAPERTETVLDIGCGTGRYTELLNRFFGTVYGLDRSAEMLGVAAREHVADGLSFVRGDATSLPFDDSVFDMVLMVMSLHQIGTENIGTLFMSIRDKLREKGALVLVTNSHSRMRRSNWAHFPGVVARDLERFPSIPFIISELKAAGFRKTGFVSVKKLFGTLPVEDYLARVEGKYISTLSIMSEDEFRRGFLKFGSWVRSHYGNGVPDEQEFVLVKAYR